MATLRDAGYRLAIFGNQPASRTAELTVLDLPVERIAMSAEMGVAKPSPAYFARVLELLGEPDPGSVAHVGDRVDNDVLPAAAAGFRSIWLRRGPWGLIQELPHGFGPALVVDTLTELGNPDRIGLRGLAALAGRGLDSRSGRTGPISPVHRWRLRNRFAQSLFVREWTDAGGGDPVPALHPAAGHEDRRRAVQAASVSRPWWGRSWPA